MNINFCAGVITEKAIDASVGAHFAWYYSNEEATDQNNPVFYLFAYYDDQYYGTLEKIEFTFVENGENSYYTAKAKDRDYSERIAIGKTYHDYPVVGDIVFPVYYSDGYIKDGVEGNRKYPVK